MILSTILNGPLVQRHDTIRNTTNTAFDIMLKGNPDNFKQEDGLRSNIKVL